MVYNRGIILFEISKTACFCKKNLGNSKYIFYDLRKHLFIVWARVL